MRFSGIVAVAISITACTDAPVKIASMAIAGPTPAVAPPPLPTAVPGVLQIAMPVEPGDAASNAFGITPFGYHGADHAEDGHAGWDIEYRIGGVVRAAAAGTVQSVSADPLSPGRSTVHVEHVVGAHHYRTVYTNITTLAPGIVTSELVRSGQAIGTAGTMNTIIGTTTLSYAMTHFQLDDFEFYRDTPHPNAVSPEPFLSPEARLLFDGLWARAAFSHEPVEPFATNPRALVFPVSRTWTRAGGNGPAGIRFTQRTPRSSGYEYALLAESGTATETGTVLLNAAARPNPTIDLVSATSRRAGIYDIVSNEMRLALAEPGAARPTSLGAGVYRTAR